MLNKISNLFINIVYPTSHLVRYLETISRITFMSHASLQPQLKQRMFYPFYYKDRFIKDCIIGLKEHNTKQVAQHTAPILAQWILKQIDSIRTNDISAPIFLIPIPQHYKKTREKGFCHTTTLTRYIHMYICKYSIPHIYIKPCIIKHTQTKKVHDTKSKRARFKTISQTMCSYLTRSDAQQGYFFLIDDVYTTGATYKEARRSLLDCAVPEERIYFVSIAH